MLDFSAEHWRDATKYRKVFLKRNRAFLGEIWFCSQCMVPLLGDKNMEVDHIIPGDAGMTKRQKEKGKQNSLLASLLNTEINTAPICKPCNLEKSNKLGVVMVAKGYTVKLFHKAIGLIQDTVILVSFISLLTVHRILFTIMKIATMFSRNPKRKKGKSSRGSFFQIKQLVMPIFLICVVVLIIYLSQK